MLNKKYRTLIGLFLFFVFAQFVLFPLSFSEVTYIATVFLNPKSAIEEYIWIFSSDDFVHKLNKSDPEAPEFLAWSTSTTFILGGCEFRLEDGGEYIYLIDSGNGVNSDMLIKYHANNGTELSRWDISSYSENAQGLVWNGSRWFIADSRDDLIYQVNPENPTIAERSFSYIDQRFCGGLAWDGLYLWAVDYGTDSVYQLDVYGIVLTNWNFAPLNPTGATYDSVSGNLWIVDRSGYLHEYTMGGTLLASWDVTRAFPKGIACSSAFP